MKYRTECKDCMKKRVSTYETENRKKSNKRKRDWDKNNKKKSNKQKNQWKKRNSDKVKIYNKKYNAQYCMRRLKEDTMFRMMHNMRTRIRNFFKAKGKSRNRGIKSLIGCDKERFREYIASQFKQGMNWQNYGKWHIDHKIPLSSAKSVEEIYDLCNYKNLQPLLALENLKKGNRIIK